MKGEKKINQNNPNDDDLDDYPFRDSILDLFKENSGSNSQDESNPELGGDVVSQEPRVNDTEEPRPVVAAACSANKKTDPSSSRNREEEIRGSDQAMNRGTQRTLSSTATPWRPQQISSGEAVETVLGALDYDFSDIILGEDNDESNQIPMPRPLSAYAPPPMRPHNIHQQSPIYMPQNYVLQQPILSAPSLMMYNYYQYPYGYPTDIQRMPSLPTVYQNYFSQPVGMSHGPNFDPGHTLRWPNQQQGQMVPTQGRGQGSMWPRMHNQQQDHRASNVVRIEDPRRRMMHNQQVVPNEAAATRPELDQEMP